MENVLRNRRATRGPIMVDGRPETYCEACARRFIEMKSVPIIVGTAVASAVGYILYAKFVRTKPEKPVNKELNEALVSSVDLQEDKEIK